MPFVLAQIRLGVKVLNEAVVWICYQGCSDLDGRVCGVERWKTGHVDVCIHCGLPSELVYDEGCYPACTACKSASKKAVKKRARTSAKK